MKMMITADESELGVLNFTCLFCDRLFRSASAISGSGRNSSSPSRRPDIIDQGSRHRAATLEANAIRTGAIIESMMLW